MLCLKVMNIRESDYVDLMNLVSVQLGFSAVRFNEKSTNSELILRSC